MTLSNITMANIRTIVSNYTVDEAMTTAKGQIQAEAKERLAKALQEEEVGLTVVNLTVQDAEPPTDEIKQAFKAVETAKQGKETAVNNAKKYQSEQVPAAEAEADRIIQNAEAQKAARIAEAEGEAAKFNSIFEEYSKYPLITKQRMFYEAMENVLPGAKVIITDGSTQQMLPLESFTTGVAGTTTTVTADSSESTGN